MDKFQLRWIDSLHTGDDFEIILQALEVGRDEGPIILVPGTASRKSASQMRSDYHALVFDNPDWLGAHLAEHQDELSHEIWLGICENVPREKRQIATGALLQFAKLLNELRVRKSKPRRSARALSREPLTCGSVKEPPIESFDVLLEQSGEVFEEIAAEFKNLPASILISRL